MQEGKWESTMQMTMEGMQFSIPSFKTTQCVTKEDLVPKTSEKEENCKRINYKVVGNTVVWKVECVDKGTKTESEGEITYSGSSYKGTMRGKITEKGGETRNFSMKLAGRRIGECKKNRSH